MDSIKSFKMLCSLTKTNDIIKGMIDTTLTENDQNHLVIDVW